MVEGERPVAHQSLLYCQSLYSIFGDVEQGSIPSIGYHPEHRVTTDHEHQPELGFLVWNIIIDSQVSIHVA